MEYGIPLSRWIIIPTPWPIMVTIPMMNTGSSKRSLFPWTVLPLQKWRLRNSPQLPIMVNITRLSNSIPMNMPLLIEAKEMMAMSRPLPFQPMGKPLRNYGHWNMTRKEHIGMNLSKLIKTHSPWLILTVMMTAGSKPLILPLVM